MEVVRLRGLAVSPGIGLGEARLSERVVFTSRRETISDNQVPAELKRLHRAFERTKEELQKLKDYIEEQMGKDQAFIFDAHLMILDDPMLRSNLEKVITEEKVKAEWAITTVNNHFASLFESLSDEYFQQRKTDISDVLARVYRHLEGKKEKKEDLDKPVILVARELLPSEAAVYLSQKNVMGVVLDMGGMTSHTAILARSLGIPAVVGLHDASLKVKAGDFIIVDGTDGEVIINPSPAIKREFNSKKERYQNYKKELKKIARLKSLTLDGVDFIPLANIELPEEVDTAFSFGAEGVGLFRSEFIYLRRPTLPSEEDHLSIYRQMARKTYPRPVYIRTIDIGGEKSLPWLNIEKEPNPALGLRAIRFSLRNRELFRTQIRAILKASDRHNVRLMVPMITELEEVVELKTMVEEVKDELRQNKIPFDEEIPIGVMIEVPGAAVLIDSIIQEVDYVSIGTNDLIQYYLAVDRGNEAVSYLFKPHHPAVLQLLSHVIKTVNKAGKEVTVCGEMAADPLSAIILLGMGLRHFSMNPIFIPRVKKALKEVETRTVQEAVKQALKLKTATAVEEFMIEAIIGKYPQAFFLSRFGS
ncbi:MAG TPA: phosphoenolpyruvate--protein phosphotransferase [Candidatus Saccharicenans sp.]|nr:phosphoenolpyruvate--protein phosphotransferase [Candidatus Saccharicenans sp.]HOL45962.1 phosphoenolpyruvate--protein phosphotransferase [Candidatus Saccharicenans sp.]HOM94989.1 phosphoenolpyruvate--protein phosphotransferase [Candidatus Saccharicenans sp.]HOP60625.1 phosphoenolpyruvate--protein phosphotransferase [Candidatus Saccharicenans sp.]HPP24641.1 phosphoenolpyruvate--protein phosphotransferase [Candidatus Saccharicenans sp.]